MRTPNFVTHEAVQRPQLSTRFPPEIARKQSNFPDFLKLQEKSAYGRRAMAQEVLSKSFGRVDGLRGSRRKVGRIALL